MDSFDHNDRLRTFGLRRSPANTLTSPGARKHVITLVFVLRPIGRVDGRDHRGLNEVGYLSHRLP